MLFPDEKAKIGAWILIGLGIFFLFSCIPLPANHAKRTASFIALVAIQNQSKFLASLGILSIILGCLILGILYILDKKFKRK
jgi:hypothetical protein